MKSKEEGGWKMEVLERKKDNYASFYFQLLYKNCNHQMTISNFQPPYSLFPLPSPIPIPICIS
ncbi:hypothetical protein [Chryseobacterium oleae]|uniref:hypothetical protein n=1 Tax=Chryseobacterium oleae TaxID=491207 RepID=UPI0011142B5A|nr:hypothetical protein [Chryseobacterium oleae]